MAIYRRKLKKRTMPLSLWECCQWLSTWKEKFCPPYQIAFEAGWDAAKKSKRKSQTLICCNHGFPNFICKGCKYVPK